MLSVLIEAKIKEDSARLLFLKDSAHFQVTGRGLVARAATGKPTRAVGAH